MKVRPATTADFDEIRISLARRIIDEYRAAGHELTEALNMLEPMLQPESCDTITSDTNEPLAIIFYWVDHDDDTITTAFMAKENFFVNLGVRPARRHIRVIQQRLGGRPVVSYSYSSHPDLREWYVAIGFRVLPESEAPLTMFRLDPDC